MVGSCERVMRNVRDAHVLEVVDDKLQSYALVGAIGPWLALLDRPDDGDVLEGKLAAAKLLLDVL